MGDNYTRLKLCFRESIKMVRIPRDGNLADLKGVIKQIYELGEVDQLDVKYEDDEGDMITVTTDGDLTLALDQHLAGPKILKLHVYAKARTGEPARLCSYFQAGFCRYGERCRFFHAKNETSSSPALGSSKLQENFLDAQMRAAAADNIEQLSSQQGLEMLHRIADSGRISDSTAYKLAKLLTKQEIRTSMMREFTNRIYCSLMGTKFVLQLQVYLNSLHPATVEKVEPYLLLMEELQLRTSNGWKCLPLDGLSTVVRSLPRSALQSELAGKVEALLEHRRRLQLLSAVSEPHASLQGAAFRQEAIIPSMEELMAVISVKIPVNKVGMRYSSVNEYLETHYRLLREDFIEPLRKGVKEYQRSISPSGEVQIYTDVQLQAIKFTANGIDNMITFRTKGNRPLGNKRLLFGSLVCISRDNFNTILWATVSGRDNNAQNQVAVQLWETSELHPGETYVMVESTAAYFEAYAHVLKSLQREDMENIPFAEHLISLEREVKEPDYLASRSEGDVYDFSSAFPTMVKELGHSQVRLSQKWPTWASTLDASQLTALKHALTKRLALIQGPPGTGKTFVGLQLVELLLQNLKRSSSSVLKGPILIVCYTNHALDQFLEGIHKNEASLIRIGGRCKSEVLKDRNLQTLIHRSWESRNLMGARVRASASARERLKELEKQIASCVNSLNSNMVNEERLHGVATEEQIRNLFYGDRKLSGAKAVATWLGSDVLNNQEQVGGADEVLNVINGGFFAAFAQPDEQDGAQEVAARGLVDEDILADDENARADGGWLQVNRRRNRVIPPQQNVEQPHELEDDEELHYPLRLFVDEPDVWSLPNGARRRLHQYWLEEIQATLQAELARLRQDFQLVCKERKEADDEIKLSLLREARVIGMTTSAAARLHEVLVSLKPEVVIAEEAAEVLEAHILASMSSFTKHLILIGDHQQLRPSVATYRLAVKHGLDVSMFERLISGGVEHVMLQVQRRMKPCISKLISGIYPSLQDHESVFLYESIRGMKSDLFFMDHRSPEKGGAEEGSKVNVGEAQLVVGLCNYLLNQNSYSAGNITILCMYTGQVQEITLKLREKLAYPSWNLARPGEAVSSEPGNVPRVSSVDDFQGEENDIIILSLVRSNSLEGGKIGFLNIPNRVCVALSRARKGLYIFGNAELLSAKSPLWEEIIGKLEEDGQIGSKLVLRCQNHPEVETSIEDPLDFKNVEDGGCSKPCEYQLNCGHVCPRRCHPSSHDSVVCPKRCLKPFSECDHRCKQLCHGEQVCPACREQVSRRISRCGHYQTMDCSEDEAAVSCMTKCEKLLPCGHKCGNLCGRPCTTTCKVEVLKLLHCGHKAMLKCHQDESQFVCQEPCRQLVPGCEHLCAGSCGRCKQGREHIPCQRKCGRELPCGHACAAGCSVPCPPCTEPCQRRCRHSKCALICGRPCKPCLEPCCWRCEHFSCDLLCFEVCRRPRCDARCSRKLRCGHDCIGLCGEPCPNKCRVCEPEVLDVISQTKLGESDAEDAFVQLLDCQHVFEVSGLDQWMDTDDSTGAGGDEAIKLKACPACRTPIRRTFRYANVVKRKLEQIEEVKKKVYGSEKVQLGFEMISERREDAAKELFKDAIRIDPGLLEAHFGLAVALCSTKDFDLAAVHLRLVAKRSSFAAETERVTEVKPARPYRPVPQDVLADYLVSSAKASEDLARKSLVQWASALAGLKMFADAVYLSDLVLRRYKDENAARVKEQAQRGLTHQVVQIISQEVGSGGHHWYRCPNGHIYAIGECGGAMQTSRCPDCSATIGGSSHTLFQGNSSAF